MSDKNNRSSHTRVNTAFDEAIIKYGQFIIKRRWWVILACVALVSVSFLGFKNFGFSTSYKAFFSAANPEMLAFEEMQDTYTKTDNFLLVLQPEKGKVFSPRIGQAIEKLTEESWKIPFAIRVDSISNFQHTWSEENDLTVENLIEDSADIAQSDFDKKQAIALAEPLLQSNLISKNAETTAINITMQFPQKDMQEVPRAANSVRKLLADIKKEYPEFKTAISGISMMNATFAESGMKDFTSITPIMYLILLIVTAITLRSISGTLATLLVIMLSSIFAMGCAGFLGYKMTPISILAPTIILTLAIADSIHILISMLTMMRKGMKKKETIIESLRINFTPITVTTITTIIGFLSLNFSETPPFWHLGNLTSIGIAMAWLFSLSLLPAVVSILPVIITQKSKEKTAKGGFFQSYTNFLVKNKYAVLVILGLFSLLISSMSYRNELNDEWVKYFDHRVQFRHDAEFTMENLGGIYSVEFSLEAKEAGGVSEPEYLENLEKYANWLRSQDVVTHVYSFSDIIKRLNKNMHGDDPTFYKIPKNRDLAAQFLLLYELSLPYGLDLNDRVSIDKSSTRLTVTIPEISTKSMRAFIDKCENWLENNTPSYMHAKATGPQSMFSLISKRNIDSMLKGNVLAIILISFTIMLAIRSWKMGLLSFIPNSIPILITFGIWGLIVQKVGMAAATVTATSLGIIVDDTVHFLAKFLRARREHKATKEEAVRYAFDTVGPAIISTTLILGIGFAFLTYSTFKINSEMGLLTSIAIVSAFIFDFTILPCLLMLGKDKK